MTDWDSTPINDAASAIRGGAAIALSKVGRQVVSLGITVILARLLSPGQFGAVAVIAAMLAIGLVVQQAGLSGATIQRPRVSQQAVSTMFWINTALGLTLTVAFVLLAHPIAGFFHRPELVPVCQVTSISFLLNGLVAQHRALLQRSMRFKTTAQIDLGSAMIGGASAVALALLGFGYWALVAQTLATDTLALVMLVSAVRWKLARPALTQEVREMVAFGSSMLGFAVVVSVAFNLPTVLIGRRAGTTAAGIYTRGYALASIPQGLLQGAAAHIALPKLARAQHDHVGFARFYYGGVQLLTLVTLPVTLAFAVFGDQVTTLVYGPGWEDVATLLRIFSVGLAVAPILHSTGPVFMARGDTRRMFRWGIFGSAVIMLGTVVGIHWGTIGVACGWSGTTLLLLLPCLIYTYRGTDLTLGALARALAGIYAALATALPIAWLSRRLLAQVPLIIELPLALGFSLICYVGLCYFAFGQKALINEVITRLRPRSAPFAS